MSLFLLIFSLFAGAADAPERRRNPCLVLPQAVVSQRVRGDSFAGQATDPFWRAPERGAANFQELHDQRSRRTEAYLAAETFVGKTASENWLDAAVNYEAARDHIKAAEWYRRAALVSRNAEERTGLFAKARENFEKAGDPKRAAEAEKSNPEEVAALKDEKRGSYSAAGAAFEKAGLFDDAARAFGKQSTKAEGTAKHAEHKRREAEMLAKAGRFEEAALESFLEGERLAGTARAAFLGEAEAYLRMGKLEGTEAMAQVLGALGKMKEAEALFRKLGKEFLDAGKWQQAIWAFRAGGETKRAAELETQVLETLKGGTPKSIVILGGGETSSYLVTFENGIQAVYKPELSTGENSAEILASLVDRRMGTDLVPLTIRRELHGATGSLHLFVPGAMAGYATRVGGVGAHGDLAWFSVGIDNLDRHDDNVMRVPQSFRRIGIDNARAFNYRAHLSGEPGRRLDEPLHPRDVEDHVGSARPSPDFIRRLEAFDPQSLREDLYPGRQADTAVNGLTVHRKLLLDYFRKHFK